MTERRPPLCVIGAGGHATVVISTAQLLGYEVLALYDDDLKRAGTAILGRPVRPTSELGDAPAEALFFAAIGHNAIREALVARWPGRKWATLIHPNAFVAPNVQVGEGTVVCAGAVVQPEAHIGAHVIINTSSSIDHHGDVADYAHVGPGARLTGHTSLGRGAMLGAGAVVVPGCRVGDYAVVGAGASVISDIEEHVVATGVPARRASSTATTEVSMSSAEAEPPRLERIYLSPPHWAGDEMKWVEETLAELQQHPGPSEIFAFEREFADMVNTPHAVAVSSGTAALHLALRLCGVRPDDEVLVSTFTFCASVNPILYEGARPVFLDSERTSWNLDPNLLEEVLAVRAATNRLPKALVLVHLYGQSADLDPIVQLCERYGVTLVEDAAEALGATYKGRAPGTFGKAGIYSFNGNKIITTSGGGMLVTEDEDLARHARKLATQARDAASHYQHSEVGFNYRLSNVLAGIGRGQLRVLDDRVAARRANFDFYRETLGDLPGVGFMPEAPWGRHSRWLTCITPAPDAFGATREDVRLALEKFNIEARPLWKPMHLQPAYEAFECHLTGVSEELFEIGLCLPSGSNLTRDDLGRVVEVVQSCCTATPAA